MEFAITGPGQPADDSWLPRALDEMVEGGLITREKVCVILYRAAKK